MDASEERGERFVKDLQDLKVRDPSTGRPWLWLRLSIAAMVAAVVLVIVAYLISHSTNNALEQRDAIVLALGAVVLAVVGAAVYVRFALGNVVRFWLARQSFDMSVQTEELAARLNGAPVAAPPSTDRSAGARS
jgi:uncharacterized membrane protein YoaK (UPF0700 family)